MAEANWYVVHTYSGYENKVKANLGQIGQTIYKGWTALMFAA